MGRDRGLGIELDDSLERRPRALVGAGVEVNVRKRVERENVLGLLTGRPLQDLGRLAESLERPEAVSLLDESVGMTRIPIEHFLEAVESPLMMPVRQALEAV